ncbi:Ig-like domain-containing protein [Haladaptatus cibarius]|uniref:Ig-like domain-containing protein n=1 Tax=Haladaptatus cibarius TaxID=453847 RepID=UPI000679C980|nr:Ig-like domain-containing protein [Haladaptatus cibarius]
MSIRQRFRSDNRAIEGLPIRLVIALVVGVASLSVMMNMLSGLNGLAVSELDAKPEPEVIEPGQQAVEIAVIDADGNPVADATVVVKSDSARLENIETATTESDGRAHLSIHPSLGANQDDGTLDIDIKPPAGSEFADKRENTRILVVSD